MENLILTSEGAERLKTINLDFPKLRKYYFMEMGNFGFTEQEYKNEIKEIRKYKKRFPAFKIVIEEGLIYLTDIK